MRDIKIVNQIAINVKKLRLSQHLSQENLADLTKVHRTYISLIERRKKVISVLILEKLAKAFNVEISELIK